MKLALGTVQFGMDYGVQGQGKPSAGDAIGIIDTAVKCGVRILDTAASYGNAETIIGAYLRRGMVSREELCLITKVRGDALAGIDANCYHNVLVQEAMASMKRLCADYLDGLLYHNPQYVFDPCAMEALVNLRHAGHINSVGVSVYTPDEVAAALQYDIDIVQAPYSVFDRRLDSTGFFKKAQECNVMVMARSVLLQGLLAMPEVPATMSFAEPYIKDFCETCGQLQLSPLEGAVGFAASHPHINCLLFGVDNKRQLDEVMNAAQKQMNHAVYEKLKCRFTNIPERVYMPRQWPKGD